MTYKVIKYFTDLQDNDYAYNAGDTFPRKGKKVSDERIAELSSANNKRGIPLIEAVKDREAKDDATPVKTVEDAEAVKAEETETTEEKPVKKGRPKKKSE